MDLAYDHIQEQALPQEEDPKAPKSPEPQTTLNADIQDAYRTISTSKWGASIGGFFGSVVKQGESVYREAQQELTTVSAEASRGFNGLTSAVISRTRGLSLASPPDAEAGPSSGKDNDVTPTEAARPALTTEEALNESESVIARLRTEATKRLKDVQRAEDAADEALLRFGSNIRDFLREAVTIAPPTGASDAQGGSTVLFESKDAQGKRIIHTSRFDAQLHVIHTTTESFTKDSATQEDDTWSREFDIDKRTADIAKDLAQYPELRTTMEKLVPDQIPYADFWKRYYFLRHGMDLAETRRKDMLKAATAEEEVAWDDDSEDESTPKKDAKVDPAARPTSAESSKTVQPSTTTTTTTPAAAAPAAVPSSLLKPIETRRSNDERSQPDSDTSYDVVGAASGVPSQAATSPKEARKAEDSEEEDWE